MENSVVQVRPEEEQGSPLLPPVSLAPMATIRQSPGDVAQHCGQDYVAVGLQQAAMLHRWQANTFARQCIRPTSQTPKR